MIVGNTREVVNPFSTGTNCHLLPAKYFLGVLFNNKVILPKIFEDKFGQGLIFNFSSDVFECATRLSSGAPKNIWRNMHDINRNHSGFTTRHILQISFQFNKNLYVKCMDHLSISQWGRIWQKITCTVNINSLWVVGKGKIVQ
jgi:hypothetical protein